MSILKQPKYKKFNLLLLQVYFACQIGGLGAKPENLQSLVPIILWSEIREV